MAIPGILFGSKGETLEKLELLLKTAKILPQIRFNAFQYSKSFIENKIEQWGWKNIPLIVRSSAKNEDQSANTAGHFISVLNIREMEEIYEAVERVLASFKRSSQQDEVFIQPMLQSVRMCGVAFSYDVSTGAPYRVINYDDESGFTNSVTSGSTNALKIYYAHRSSLSNHPEPMNRVIDMLVELESYFEKEALDVEFAVTEKGELFLLQVRPLFLKATTSTLEEHRLLLKNIEFKIETLSQPHPYLRGDKAIFGVMPDWNPAEIIGLRPRPLSLSLYKEIVTDVVWASQRENYGYHDLRNFPLLVHFYGLPYIDVRVSLNSFIPADLDDHLAEKIVNYYLNKLKNTPHLHDKIEFDIVFSCFTPDFLERACVLKEAGFSQTEIDHLAESLKKLTNRILDPKKGCFSLDLQKIKKLEERISKIHASSLSTVAKIYWFLEDGKRYGTTPFAGIARAAFIAMQFLKSLIHLEILKQEEAENFLFSLNTICAQLQKDKTLLNRENFLKIYGHLREGTYDILSPRYDEAPNAYFDWRAVPMPLKNDACFTLTAAQIQQINTVLDKQGVHCNAAALFTFMRLAIEGREYAKFLFTKSLSAALDLVKQLGLEWKFNLEECSYMDIQDIKKLYSCCLDVRSFLCESISRGKNLYATTQELFLPPLITDPKNVWSFDVKQISPNYITLKKAKGQVCLIESCRQDISGRIAMILSADPGYDWIFTHSIVGLITMYGGLNSHMSIRSAELGIPAVIGAGEILYHRWSQAKMLEIDCFNKIVRVIA